MNVTPVSFGMTPTPIPQSQRKECTPTPTLSDPFSNDWEIVNKSVNNALENGKLLFRTPEGRLINISNEIKNALKNHYYIPNPIPTYAPNFDSKPIYSPTPLPKD